MKFSRLPLLSVAAFSLYAVSASAASTTALPNLSEALSSQASEASSKADSTESAAQTSGTAKNTGSNTAETTGGTSGKTTSTGPSPTAVITGSGSAAGTALASITGGSSASNGGALPSGLPTLSGAFVIVAPTVPPTADAPFMRVSNLPDGTVFIVVGAVLGFMAMSVLLWRALVAWSLHRSVKRAAIAQSTSHEKTLFRGVGGVPAAPFYQYKDRESTISLGNLAGGKRKSMRPTTAPGAASVQNLFFSPTAGATLNNAGNRGSNYLPAGYYAAGAAQPGDGKGMAHIGHGGNGNSISLSNLGPARDGYARARSIGPSPPGSPAFPAQQGGGGYGMGASSSTLDLNRAPGDGRAPSVFLDDLFDSEGGPPVPSHHANGSQHRF